MYYLLEMKDFEKPRPYRTRYEPPDRTLRESAWFKGQAIRLKPGTQLRFELWEYQAGHNGLAEIFLDTVSLFREDFLATLKGCGVDNLQVANAILEDPKRKLVARNYKAVNIVGAIRCADLEHSEYDDPGGTGLIAMVFRKLVIDEKKAGGALFFRLAEAVASIIVHQRVRDALETKSFRYVQLSPLG